MNKREPCNDVHCNCNPCRRVFNKPDVTSKSEMTRKNALAGKPLDEGLSSKPTSVLCPICLVGAKDTSEAECASCRSPVEPLAPGKSEIPHEAGKAAEEYVEEKFPEDDADTRGVAYLSFKAGYDARDAYLLKLHGEGAMAEVIQLQAEVRRLEEELMLAEVGAVHYQSERDIHIKEQETFNHEAVKKIQEMGIENKQLRDALHNLVCRLDFVHEHPSYIGVWHVSQLHVGPYKGPKYEDELARAREALKARGPE